MRRGILLAVAIGAHSVVAAAQVAAPAALVRGQVVLADGITRAAGVMVVIIDANNAAAATSPAVASGLTNSTGQFSIRLPAPGRYGARVLRIGFRPTVVAPFDVIANAPAVLSITLGSEAVRLTEVKVKGEDVCRIRADSGKLVAQVWEQARQALASTRLSPFDGGLHVTALLYDRTLDSVARTVLRSTASTSQGFTDHAFASVSGDSLNIAGYARKMGESVEYLGPDADALISDSFASSHCFRILPPTPQWPRSVGVGFRPARERKGIVDIAGIFWLDRETAELQALEYSFTNLSREWAEPGAGGRIEFARLESGSWIVNRWRIRVETAAPRNEPAPTRAELGARPINFRRWDRFVNAIGGEVVSARNGEKEIYATNRAVLDAVVVPGKGSPLMPDSVDVELEGPGYFAAGDSVGRVHFARLRPGTYDAVVTTKAMRAAALPAVARKVTAREGAPGTMVDTLRLPSGEEMVKAICGERARARETFVAGTLRDSAGVPMALDTVRGLWHRGYLSSADFLSSGHDGSFTAVTDLRGRWFACGLPHDISVTAHSIRLPPSALHSVTRMKPDADFAVIDVVGVRRN